jgi:nucleoside-diphosphate-sugar epimerase
VRILVLGNAGFIGRHLTRELEEAGHHVIGIDREPFNRDHQFQKDLLSKSYTLYGAGADRCIHLAAHVGRLFGEVDPEETIRGNAALTTIVAKRCAAVGIPLTYVSTSEIYGDHGQVLLDEYHGPFGLPHNLYGLTKRWGEEISQLYAPDGLQIIRPTMPYGPGTSPGWGRRAIDNMLWQAHHGMRIEVHNGAHRSWCWIGDLVRGIRLVLEHGEEGTWNVGRDDDDTSMIAVACLACAIAGVSGAGLIDVVDVPEMQTAVKRLSCERLRVLGWEPEVGLVEGMEMLYDWVKRFDEDGTMVA